MITESIYDNGKVIIPMAEISHIERDQRESYKGGVTIIFKHSKWDDTSEWVPAIFILPKEAPDFLKSWCIYRSEIEGIKQDENSISEQMKEIWK